MCYERRSILEQVLSIYALIREELITKVEDLHKIKRVKFTLSPDQDQEQVIREISFASRLTLRIFPLYLVYFTRSFY